MIAGLAAITMLALGQATIGSAQAVTTVTVAPSAGGGTNTFPFGIGVTWTPNLLWVYKNVPAFQLKAGDVLAFDLQGQNNLFAQVNIALAPTTVNGGDEPAAAFTQVVPNTALAADPDGNTTTGDYELAFTAQAPFNFAGGGLIIRISNPGGPFAGDMTSHVVFVNNLADATDPSGFFVKRIVAEPDGVFPWGGASATQYVAGFRLTLADVPVPVTPAPIAPSTPKKKRKCKKKKRKGAAAAKKCKKKKKR